MSVIKCALVLCVAIAATNGFALGPTQIVFHLYVRGATQSTPLLPNLASIMTSDFNPALRSVITIHDHGESVAGNFNAHVVNAHLAAENVNVIAVDWSPGSTTSYSFSLSNTPQVGTVVAQFVNILSSNFGYEPRNVRIVGVGLGAHAAGIAARKINGNVPHIFALNPSLIGWTHHPDILSRNDANVVEVLHTTTGDLSYDSPLGDIEFYPNGGKYQPNCGFNSTCSHMYSYIFYAESVLADTNNGPRFIGTSCGTYDNAVNQTCQGARDATFGGVSDKISGSGIYTFLTNPTPPFARN